FSFLSFLLSPLWSYELMVPDSYQKIFLQNPVMRRSPRSTKFFDVLFRVRSKLSLAFQDHTNKNHFEDAGFVLLDPQPYKPAMNLLFLNTMAIVQEHTILADRRTYF